MRFFNVIRVSRLSAAADWLRRRFSNPLRHRDRFGGQTAAAVCEWNGSGHFVFENVGRRLSQRFCEVGRAALALSGGSNDSADCAFQRVHVRCDFVTVFPKRDSDPSWR
jgi:hypothetical protein